MVTPDGRPCAGRCRVAMVTLIWMLILLDLAWTDAVQQISNPRIVEHPEDQYVARNEPATLNCKAEGEPPPVITWYKRGQPVITANENPASHRMLLPSGQLFFLKIIHNSRNQTDVGVYYCNATNPETRVSAVSRNATLDIATIRDDFREYPKSVDVAVGGEAVLPCKPPRGKPEPRVRWKKDSEAVKVGERFVLDESGSLKLRDTRKEDSGMYICVAYNVGGEKESPAARLTVREKPRILEGPKEATIQENSDVLFRCRTNGDPELTIIWKKQDGQIPPGRSRILEDRSLKIEKADVSDEGIYICRVENAVGFQEAEARLSVHSQPSFVVTPHDKVVGIGRRATFRCQVTGNPLPAIYWSKETSQQNPMFPNYDNGRFSVTDDGTLIVEAVQKDDAGEYVCKGLSVAGSAYAKARLDVKDLDPRPPPIIHQGPQNQTLPINSVAMLQCSASGEPVPVIRWYKNQREVPMKDPRFALLDSGTLQISDLRKADSGLYTCKAASDTGETTWSAGLTIEAPTNPSIIFHRTPEPSTFPGSPSKPVIQEITETSVRLAWNANTNHGSSPVHAYTVEYFSHETGEGWVIATDSVTDTVYTVRNLRQDTPYMFLVRSQNSHGLSMPSPVTSTVRTKGGLNIWASVPQSNPALVAEKLSSQIVTVLQPEVLNSTAVRVTWDVKKNLRYIEGFHVKYRMLLEQEELSSPSLHPHGSHHSEFVVETVQSPSVSSHILYHLAKYTWYEVRVQPFHGTIGGQDSNTIRVRTFEDVPSAPPDNVQWKMTDNSTMHLTWDPPPKNQRNGPLRGYRIYLYGNESRFDRELHANSSSDFIVIPNLIKDMTYRVQIAAYNRIGEGVRSDIYRIGPPQPSGVHLSVMRQPWFIATLILTIGGALWFALCVFSVWLYKKRKNSKTQKSGVVPVPVRRSEAPGSLGYASNSKSSYNAIPSAPPQPDVTCQAVGTYDTKAQNNINDYYSDCKDSAPPLISPYAMAAIPVGGGGGGSPFVRPKLDGAFRPIQSYMIQKNYNEDDANQMQKEDPPRYTPTEHCNFVNGPLAEFLDCHPDDAGMYGRNLPSSKQPMLFLPPPPEHPPPSDIGTPPDSPTLGRFGNASGVIVSRGPLPSEFTSGGRGVYKPQGKFCQDHSGSDRSRSFSPRSQAAIDDISYPQLLPQIAHRYGQCPSSPKQQTASPRAYHHHNPRTYSPQGVSDPEYGQAVASGRSGYEQGNSYELCHPFSDTEGMAVPAHLVLGRSPPSPAPVDPKTDRAIQSSLPSLISECITPLPSRPDLGRGAMYGDHGGAESPISEIGAYPGLESDLETNLPRDCHSPVSSVDEMERAVADSVLASWTNAIEDSDTNCSSVRSSAVSSSDGSFFAEADFASAVARAAEMSGLTVIGSTVIDPNGGKDREKSKKSAKHRQRAQRPTSPYSTDSNYSAIQVPHKPYPKSERKKQLVDQGGRYKPMGNATKCLPVNSNLRPLPNIPSKTINGYDNSISNSASNNNSDTGSSLLKSTSGTPSGDLDRAAVRTNPLEAFDMRDTPIV